jgi:hypothetical protein
MKLRIRVNSQSFRAYIADEANAGRIPIARLKHGYVIGRGWGFLHPWEQQAIFPQKGTPAGWNTSARVHEPFWILRLWPTWCAARHRNHDYDIEGRYWHGLVWRQSWGWRRRWGINLPNARRAFLDPDIVTNDPKKAPGHEW